MTPCAKVFKKAFYVILLKIWSFYPKYRNFSSFFTLEMVILVRAMNKCFQKYV